MSDVIAALRKSASDAVHLANEPYWFTDMLPCGVAAVDWALGGGVGYGRVAELVGDWSTGKTLLLYMFLAQNQQRGGISVLFEAEGAFNAEFFAALGGNPDTLWTYNLETCEEFFNAVFLMCKTKVKSKENKPYAVGWDSIAATGTKHLMDTDMETRDMSKANVMNLGAQKLRAELKDARIAVISTNQTREKIGSYDSAVHTPGGKSWPFIASQRIHMMFDGGDKTSKILDREGKVEIGRWVKGKVIKNKLASPFGEFMLPIYIEEGFYHPTYEQGTVKGIHLQEALFFNYLREKIYLPSKRPMIIMPSNGWYAISPEALPSGGQNFRKSDWPKVLEDHPWLYQYPYTHKTPADDLKNSSAQSAQEQPNVPTPPPDGSGAASE
jgi:RecA/RadA recombinase